MSTLNGTGNKKWQELSCGSINTAAGNTLENYTGSLRRGEKPEFNPDNCINCFFCWAFCPENAIIIDYQKISGINYDYCKGCGICANECPVNNKPLPIVMVEEKIEL